MPRRDVMPAPMKVRWPSVVHNACLRKVAHPTVETATTALGNDREHYVYRCPFAVDGAHWHIGRPPDMKTLRKIASAIRERAQGVVE